MSDPRKRVEELYVILARDEAGKEWLVGFPCITGHETPYLTAAPEHVENMVKAVRGGVGPAPALVRVVRFTSREDMQIIEEPTESWRS